MSITSVTAALKNVFQTLLPVTLSCFGLILAMSFHARAQSGPATAKPGQVPPVMAPGTAPGMEKAPVNDVGAVKMAKVYFVTPKDGATVPTKFTAKFGLEGMKVAKVGDMTPGTGHFHVIIDAPASKEGEFVATDATHLHFGKGQLETELTLTPGKHKLVLQLADGTHKAFGPQLAQEITVNVK